MLFILMKIISFYDIISAEEKQAALKATFVFLALLTNKQTAKQAEERQRRGLVSLYDH